jgi:phage terminase small subunit
MALTAKQEQFAVLWGSGKTKMQAYLESHDVTTTNEKTIYANAREVSKNPAVAELAAKIRAEAAEEAKITLASHLRELEEIKKRALERESFSAAVQAEISRGKASGLYIDRIDVSVTEKPPALIINRPGAKQEQEGNGA